MCNVEFCGEMLENLDRITLSEASRRTLKRYLKWAIDGADIPLYIDVHEFCRKFKFKPPSMDTLISALEERGVKSTRTFYNFRGIKVENLESAENILREIVAEIQEKREI